MDHSSIDGVCLDGLFRVELGMDSEFYIPGTHNEDWF